MERLSEKCGDRWIPRQDLRNNGHDKCLKRLAEYEDAEEQGLLIRLPCKVGDNILYKDEYSSFTFTVTEIKIDTEIRIMSGNRGCIVYANGFDKYCKVIN